jgi:hypothetical protein
MDKDLEQRFTNQQNRIGEAIKSKQLTLTKQRFFRIICIGSVRRVRLQADGKLSQEENAQLSKLLDQNSEMIRDKKQYPVKAITMAAPTAASTAAPATSAATTQAKPAPTIPAAQDPEIKEKIGTSGRGSMKESSQVSLPERGKDSRRQSQPDPGRGGSFPAVTERSQKRIKLTSSRCSRITTR